MDYEIPYNEMSGYISHTCVNYSNKNTSYLDILKLFNFHVPPYHIVYHVFQLIHNRFVNTHTSIKENIGSHKTTGSKVSRSCVHKV